VLFTFDLFELYVYLFYITTIFIIVIGIISSNIQNKFKKEISRHIFSLQENIYICFSVNLGH